MGQLHGKNGNVKIGTVTYAFDAWTSNIETDLGEISNFDSVGFKEFLTGFTGATVDIEGPYNQGAMAFTSGTTYSWSFGYNNSVAFTGSGILNKISVDVKAKDPVRVKLSVTLTGTFTPSIT